MLHPLLLTVAIALHVALPVQAADTKSFTIGYLQLKQDDRYKEKRLFASFLGQPLGRPYAGAEIALKEMKFHGLEAGVEFALEKAEATDSADLNTQLDALKAKGVHFVLTDLPANELAEFAKTQRDQEIVLFNVSAADNSLRQEQCQPNLFHTLPSQAMLTDALAQYLVFRKWNKALELEGPLEADKQFAISFEQSAKKYGIKLLDKRPFVLSNDPREREMNNMALLSGGDQDVIFIADTQGEFARGMPYQTVKPNLLVGSEGLAPVAWHWSWDRHGAPQLEKRFERKYGRPMASEDWAAWMAMKTIANAVQTSKSADFATLRTSISAQDNLLDNFKGTAGTFRPWNNQLRQPILLATHNWVIERAPLQGFLHQKNNLDTLGADERDSKCQF